MNDTTAAESTVQYPVRGRGWCIGLGREVEVVGPVYGPFAEGANDRERDLIVVPGDDSGSVAERADVVPAFKPGTFIRSGLAQTVGLVLNRGPHGFNVQLSETVLHILWQDVTGFMESGHLMEGSGLSEDAERLMVRLLAQKDDAHVAAARSREDADAVRDEFATFKRTVGQVAMTYAREHDWCSVVTQGLDELGIDVPDLSRTVRVTLEVDVTFKGGSWNRDDDEWGNRAEYLIDGIEWSGATDDDGEVDMTVVEKSYGEVTVNED